MIGQIDLAGNFTLFGTSMTMNRMGYGAMQLAGRDGNKLVWGPPRDIDGAIAVLREARAASLSRGSSDRHQSQRPARCGWIMDSGFLTRRSDGSDSRQPP